MADSTDRRFTIRDLLGFTAFVGVCLGAFRLPGPGPAMGYFGIFGAVGAAVAYGVSRRRKYLAAGFILGIVLAPVVLGIALLVMFVLLRALE